MKLNICWLKDDRPGHLTKARGILKALRCQVEIDVREISIRWKPNFLKEVCPRLPLMNESICLAESVPRDTNLILSAGGATEWANAKSAMRLGIPNIFLGSLRTQLARDFTILPRIEPDFAPQVILMDLVPSEFDWNMASDAANATLPDMRDRYWTVLVGGNGSGCQWTLDDHVSQARQIAAEATRADVFIIVTTSRRTSPAAERIWRDALSKCDRLALGVWHHDSNSVKKPVIAALIGRADRIIVSEDSASMVNEAVASGRPVATIAPANSRLTPLLERMLQRLATNRRIIRLSGNRWHLADVPDTQWSVIEPGWHAELGRELLARIEAFNPKKT